MSDKRAAAFPDVPTMKEQGLPKLVVQTWYGLFAPAGTPAAIIAKLNSEMNVLLGQVEVGEVLARQDMIAVGGTPERFATLVSATWHAGRASWPRRTSRPTEGDRGWKS